MSAVLDMPAEGGAVAPGMARPYLDIRSVGKQFGTFVALKDVTLEIAEGEFVSFLGPSGCGKTTLLRTIAGLDPATAGVIRQAGREITGLPPAERDFGIVFQSYALFPNLSVSDNIGYGLRGPSWPKQRAASRVAELIQLVGLAEHAKKYPAQISSGQQQRVALARALAPEPGLLLLDEPLSALDAIVRLHLRQEIRALQRRLGVTTIMVTHDQEEAMGVSDRIVVLSRGRVEQVGSPEEIYRRPSSAFVASFVGRASSFDAVVDATPGTLKAAGFTIPADAARGMLYGTEVRAFIRPEAVCLGVAAQALKASSGRIFRTVTLPGARFGLVSAAVVVFTLVITDFGIQKVIGGQFPVLATDVYKQVVGLQDFNMGAVVGMVLLLPAIGAFALQRWAEGQRTGTMSGRVVPYVPRPRIRRDGPLLALCLGVALLLCGIVGVAIWGSLIRFWPYNLTLTLDNYDFGRFDSAGWGSFTTSLELTLLSATIGSVLVFMVAYLLERVPRTTAAARTLRNTVGLLATAPLAIPGLVLGLAYIMFFNEPANPFGFLYGTLAILVLNSLVHFYTVGHLTASTAVRQLDPEFEAVGASLKVPVWITFGRVTLPMCLPALLEIWIYLFVNALTTVSAVIFLYGPDNKPASVAVVHMDEAGQSSAAAAMACVLLAAATTAKLAQLSAGAVTDRLTQAWRRR